MTTLSNMILDYKNLNQQNVLSVSTQNEIANCRFIFLSWFYLSTQPFDIMIIHKVAIQFYLMD